jgi:hypothetical protein
MGTNGMRVLAVLGVVLASLPGCVTAVPEERRAYALARPHAWVEVTIADASIPSVPTGDASEPGLAPPDTAVTLEDVYEAITGRRSPQAP